MSSFFQTGFDDSCIELLVSCSPHLYNLQLSELGKLNDHSLSFLHPLKNLTTLDISRAGVVQGMVLTDQSVIALLAEVGRGLVQLTLDRKSNPPHFNDVHQTLSSASSLRSFHNVKKITSSLPMSSISVSILIVILSSPCLSHPSLSSLQSLPHNSSPPGPPIPV